MSRTNKDVRDIYLKMAPQSQRKTEPLLKRRFFNFKFRGADYEGATCSVCGSLMHSESGYYTCEDCGSTETLNDLYDFKGRYAA